MIQINFKNWLFVGVLGFLFFTTTNNTYAAKSIVPLKPKPAIEQWKNFKASELIRLSAKEYSSITGERMNLKQKISFSILKSRMKHELKKNPDLIAGQSVAAQKKLGTGWWIVIVVGVVLVIGIIIFAIEGIDVGLTTG